MGDTGCVPLPPETTGPEYNVVAEGSPNLWPGAAFQVRLLKKGCDKREDGS